MAKTITIDPHLVTVAQDMFSEIIQVRPEHSLSFRLTEEGVGAVNEALKLAEWGIGGNKPKLKATAIEYLEPMSELKSGDPVNLNFTEYEIKAMQEVLAVIEKALEEHEEGELPA